VVLFRQKKRERFIWTRCNCHSQQPVPFQKLSTVQALWVIGG